MAQHLSVSACTAGFAANRLAGRHQGCHQKLKQGQNSMQLGAVVLQLRYHVASMPKL